MALAMTLPRLFRPMIKAAADSEKPTEFSTAGVQNVTVTRIMNTMKNGTQSSTVGTARPSVNRCFTGTPCRAGSGGATSSAPAGHFARHDALERAPHFILADVAGEQEANGFRQPDRQNDGDDERRHRADIKYRLPAEGRE